MTSVLQVKQGDSRAATERIVSMSASLQSLLTNKATATSRNLIYLNGIILFRKDDSLVTLGRFELPTCGLGNRRSIHLSYRATLESLQRTCTVGTSRKSTPQAPSSAPFASHFEIRAVLMPQNGPRELQARGES
jgi:hypothetical protein